MAPHTAADTSLRAYDDLLRLTPHDATQLRLDARAAAWPLAKQSFWLAADEPPASPLEALARKIFDLHVHRSRIDPATSGAEFWANVSESEAIHRARDPHGDVAMHFDKDERLYSAHCLFVHPLVSTVTYITDVGAPTIVAPAVRVTTEGDEYRPALDSVDVTLVAPRVGRHLAFDGRWLHGAPAALCPSSLPYVRVTFLVNIWVNHKPVGVPRFRSAFHSGPPLAIGRLRRRSLRDAPLCARVKARRLRGSAQSGGSSVTLPVLQTGTPHRLSLCVGDALRQSMARGEMVTLLGAQFGVA